MNDFNKALFGRLLRLKPQVLDEDLAVQDPDLHAEIWFRYMELMDLARELNLVDDFHRFERYQHYLAHKKEAHHETVRPL